MQLFAGLILLIAVIGATASENGQSPNPRIVNGINAQPTPYNAYILYLTTINGVQSGFFGGGSLISDRHVLTAAQNIQGFSMWEIGLGSTVFGQLIKQVSSQAISHPSFNSQNRANDIGIVILPSPVIFSAAIAPIALPQVNRQMPMENEEGMVVGFGFTSSSDQGQAAFLKTAYQRVIGDNRCSGTYQIQLPNHFCAEDTTHRGNVCNGDLGAGFTIQDRRIETLAGVASLITASCDSLTPTGYTRVSVYRQWIRDTTGV
ncbi:chymotrypsin BI-like [Anopheles aquasalis]|nr:chymotrypsin BI-like [Anopheles aquasalis]